MSNCHHSIKLFATLLQILQLFAACFLFPYCPPNLDSLLFRRKKQKRQRLVYSLEDATSLLMSTLDSVLTKPRQNLTGLSWTSSPGIPGQNLSIKTDQKNPLLPHYHMEICHVFSLLFLGSEIKDYLMIIN